MGDGLLDIGRRSAYGIWAIGDWLLAIGTQSKNRRKRNFLRFFVAITEFGGFLLPSLADLLVSLITFER